MELEAEILCQNASIRWHISVAVALFTLYNRILCVGLFKLDIFGIVLTPWKTNVILYVKIVKII